ncbi:nucleotidyl transferase AbiEii/AbiGii toxin family protein [Patescibacteria group bacterium]|nr:nucleotidyl transferase AbiEii/AbiGii toxin family protein [Patescibacteria group bacterium]
MLDTQIHETVMKRILREIYQHQQLQSQLVFKGGTCLYFFYDLPRFSTDLDFSFHQQADVEQVPRVDLAKIVSQNLEIKRDEDKRFTWLWIGSFDKGKQKVKVEVNKRRFSDTYTEHEFYGLTVRSLDLESMFAHKLCAVTDRKKLVNRDLYDTWWLLTKNVAINNQIVQERTGQSVADYLLVVKSYIRKNVSHSHVLQGLGEVLAEPQKDWARDHLLDELFFELELRIEVERGGGRNYPG